MIRARAQIRKLLPARRYSPQGGFALPEVLVSAVVLTLIAGATLTALTATKEAGAQERFRSQAQAIAQQDQARLRAIRISTLTNSFTDTRTVNVDGNEYTVTSSAQYVSEATGTTSCTQNTASTQYVKISSSVTWPSLSGRPAVLLASVMAVPTGSSASNRGAIQVSIQDAAGAPRSGVPVTASGPTNLSGTTSANGCVTWANIPTGTYTVTPSIAGVVDPNGAAPAPQTVDIAGQSTKTIALQYDTPGTIAAEFQYRGYTGTTTAGSAVGFGVYQTGLTTDRFFGTGALQASQSSQATLFPFSTAYAAYAGTCTANNPQSGSGLQPALVTAGQTRNLNTVSTAGSQKIQLFPLYLNAYQGVWWSLGAKSVGATVIIKDLDCPKTYSYTTNGSGQLDMPGLPYSDYSVCVRGQSTSGTRMMQYASVAVKSTTGTSLNVPLRDGTASGTCPT